MTESRKKMKSRRYFMAGRKAAALIVAAGMVLTAAGCGSAGMRGTDGSMELSETAADGSVEADIGTSLHDRAARDDSRKQIAARPDQSDQPGNWDHNSGGQQDMAADVTEVPVYKGREEVPGGLPSSYDARKDGRTSAVKDQGDLGTCWAFASLLALESTLLPEEAFDFSEDHMSSNPSFTLGQEAGGEYTMSMAYLLAWKGPVLESDDPYGDGISPEGLQAAKHVQEIQMLPSRDLEAIKRAVYRCGGVQSSLYTTLKNSESESEYYNRTTRAYCYPSDIAPNHDVVIVGWDDGFPKESFPVEVEGDGAFLCENSWGTQFGEDGFFYVSYYDANIGKNNILYSSVEETDNYDHIYQSDLCGWIGQLGYGRDTAWAVNVYTSVKEEQLEAVGFYATAQDTEYEVYVVRGVPERPDKDAFEHRQLAARGRLDYAGFYTVPVQGDVMLEPGERYGVMIKLTTPGVVHPIAIEYDAGDGKCKVDLTDGEGYISLEGKQWQHVEAEQKCNLCLKAYTRNH